MEKIARQCLLYDFYGELLTEHQKNIYETAVYHDLSPTEIAQEQGVSRQGVHDLIKRCDHILEEYENKLHLVERFVKMKERVKQLSELAETEISKEELRAEIKRLSQELMDSL